MYLLFFSVKSVYTRVNGWLPFFYKISGDLGENPLEGRFHSREVLKNSYGDIKK